MMHVMDIASVAAASCGVLNLDRFLPVRLQEVCTTCGHHTSKMYVSDTRRLAGVASSVALVTGR